MISVEEAIQRIERAFSPLGAEMVALDQGLTPTDDFGLCRELTAQVEYHIETCRNFAPRPGR